MGEFSVFLYIAIGTSAAGVVLLLLAPVLKRMMHGTDRVTPTPATDANGASVAPTAG